MLAVYILALLGVNALAFSVLVAFVFRPDRLPDLHRELRGFLSVVFTMLSFPGYLVFEAAMRKHASNVYVMHMIDMHTLERELRREFTKQSSADDDDSAWRRSWPL